MRPKRQEVRQLADLRERRFANDLDWRPAIVLAQIESCISDIGVDAIKIGMIGSAETAMAVADYLANLQSSPPRRRRPQETLHNANSGRVQSRVPLNALRGGDGNIPIVFDPVMVATSGSALADADTIAAFQALMNVATLVTPNRPELAALGGAETVLAHGCALLEKGGHGDTEIITDRLYPNDPDQAPVIEWEAPRIDTTSTHGTGCTLASAIAAGLGQGMPLISAIARARDFVRLALLGAPGLGGGHGPMGQGSVRNDALLGGPVLNQITLPASHYESSVAFYKLLGLTQIVDSPGVEGKGGYARFEAANGVTLSIHVGDGVPGAGATTYLELAALDVWHAWLLRQGVRFDQPPRDEDWGWREARLTDPAGNRLCLYQAGEYRRYPPWRI